MFDQSCCCGWSCRSSQGLQIYNSRRALNEETWGPSGFENSVTFVALPSAIQGQPALTWHLDLIMPGTARVWAAVTPSCCDALPARLLKPWLTMDLGHMAFLFGCLIISAHPHPPDLFRIIYLRFSPSWVCLATGGCQNWTRNGRKHWFCLKPILAFGVSVGGTTNHCLNN